MAKKKKKKKAKSVRRTTRTPVELEEEAKKITNMELILGNEKLVIIRMLEAFTSNQYEIIQLLREIRDRLPEKS